MPLHITHCVFIFDTQRAKIVCPHGVVFPSQPIKDGAENTHESFDAYVNGHTDIRQKSDVGRG